MINKTIDIKQSDGYITKVTACYCDTQPVASILIFHGMAEHCKRYLDFAFFLTEHDIDVYLYDHRGHGEGTRHEDLGFIAASGGDRLLTDDAINITRELARGSRTSRFFIMGHSMGSFICRIVIQSVDNINGAIICGTAFHNAATKAGGLFLSGAVSLFKGPHHTSPFINQIMFGGKAYLSLSDRTIMDWLSRDPGVVGKYISDPLCGFVCTASFYHDLIKLVQRSGNPADILKTRKDFPLFIISGDEDPVGDYGKQVRKLIDFYTSHGFTAVESKLYPKYRHELLNELNKNEVYDDILAWLTAHM